MQIGLVVHLRLCLALHTEASVGLDGPEAALHQAHQPLCHIPYQEAHVEHLPLLERVDALVPQFGLSQSAVPRVDEEQPKEVERMERPARKVFGVDEQHMR